jgi:imidazolonepropionase-like amidohydrolase
MLRYAVIQRIAFMNGTNQKKKQGEPRPVLLLADVRLVDGTGAPPVEQVAVLIEGKRIAAVGPEEALDLPTEDVERVDLAGMTLLPGLIDCHVHIFGDPDPTSKPYTGPYVMGRNILRGAKHARQTLEAGFTTIQDMMSPNEQIFPLRESIAAEETVGSRIMAAGKCITITGGHGTQYGPGNAIEADGPEEVFKAVRQQIRAGADVIKVMATRPAFSPPFRGREAYQVEELEPGVAEAHRAGLRVCAHAHSIATGIRNAVLAGVDSVEHGSPTDDDLLELMAERGTFLVPTLSVSAGFEECIELGTLPYAPEVIEVERRLAAAARRTVARARELGVPIALGSDAAMPHVWHGGNAREIELLVDHGLTPMEAIVAGTRAAAENLGRADDLGTVETGKLADLVAVAGDPLADIRVLQDKERIQLVVLEGRIVVDRRS